MPRHATNFKPVDFGIFDLDFDRPIVDQLYTQVRAKILSLQLLPDAEVSETALALAAGVSRTPARQVVKLLVGESLLRTYPSRGTFVSRIDLDRLTEAMFVRQQLEPALAALRATDENRSDLVDLLRANLTSHENALMQGDTDTAYVLDAGFHKAICETSKGSFAWDVIYRARTEADRLHALGTGRQESLADALTQHIRIVDAIALGDEQAAHKAMSAHMQHNEEILKRVRTEHPDLFE